MIQIVKHDNNFVNVTLTKKERIDIATIKRVAKDVIKICDGKKLAVNVYVSKQTTLHIRTRKYFTKLVSLRVTNNISFNWNNHSFIKYTEKEAILVSKEVQEYFSF